MAADRRLYFLLARAQRAAATHANAVAAGELGVTATQLGALYLVARSPGISMTHVARELDVRKSAMSGLVHRLEEAGLVRRESKADDLRANALFLTAKGERIKDASIPLVRRLTREMTEGFEPHELEIVTRFLASLMERYGTDDTRRVSESSPDAGAPRA